MWDEIKALSNEEDWNKLGFQKTAAAYFDAVEALLKIFEKRNGRFPPIPSDCEKGAHLKTVLSL